MSDFDANDYRGIKRIEPSPAAVAMRELHRIKAPTKRAALIAQTITQLSTQAAVNEFTAAIRRQAQVQDLSLLPDSKWKIMRRVGTETQLDGWDVKTSELATIANNGRNVRIDWPSVTFHWGVRVTFENASGTEYIAFSADYKMTETYMSS